MKKSNNSTAGIVISILGIGIAFVAYWLLPENIPVQWGVNGIISIYAPKIWILAMGLLPVAVYSFFGLVRKIDPKKESYNRFSSVYEILRVGISSFMVVMLAITIFASFYPTALKMDLVICVMVGLLNTIFGNYMPKIKHNFFCGIRTPWTIASPEVWTKTHRLAGKVWVIGGIVIICTGFIFSGSALLFIMLATVLTMVIIPTGYSYYVFNKK